jgi:hypothetical protein
MGRAKAYLGGGCGVIVAIGIYQGISGKSVSPFVYTLCAAATILSAIWVYGLEEYRALEPRLTIGKPTYYPHPHPTLTHSYRFSVGNKSKAKTIKNATPYLIDIQPKPGYWTWGSSLPLQWKDSLKPVGSTERYERKRDIHAGTPEEADFIYAVQNATEITLNHAVDRISEHTIPLPPDHYLITVEVRADDVPSVKAVFDVWMDKYGKLQCV